MMKKVHEISRVCPSHLLADILAECEDKWIVLQLSDGKDIEVEMLPGALERMVKVGDDSGASMVYADYYDYADSVVAAHPVCDWQVGSVRDDFDFGPLVIVNREAYAQAIAEAGKWEYAGWYSLWLALSRRGCFVHLKEKISVSMVSDTRSSGQKQFDYVDPRNREVQMEMEQAFTMHLKAIGAWLPERITEVDLYSEDFPTEATVVIPVRNRVRTVAMAVESALSQLPDFSFNVIVVDNHSTDGTSEVLERLAEQDSRVIHIIPTSKHLGIGGCWNLAVADKRCGRFAVQLDSDDIYKDTNTLQQIVDLFRSERCAMVVGSYELVDFDGNPIPPGLIDHREWTAENGHNNALRINGLGAPRAFLTPVFRSTMMPDVSYGEDYAMGLCISRNYKIGRIFSSLYLCRRWKGNSDASLRVERVNTNNDYKDFLRSVDIRARQNLNSVWK